MLATKREVSQRIDILNKKPMIRKNQSTGEMVAGFLDPLTGGFEVVMDINDERDIDDFLEEYDLSVVMQEGLPSFFTFYERNSQDKSDGEKGILYIF